MGTDFMLLVNSDSLRRIEPKAFLTTTKISFSQMVVRFQSRNDSKGIAHIQLKEKHLFEHGRFWDIHLTTRVICQV